MRNVLALALKALISGALLYFAFAHVKFELIGRQLDRLNYAWAAGAVAILIGQIVFGAWRWQAIVAQSEALGAAPVSGAHVMRYMFIASFFNQTLPSTVGGDAVRIWLLGRDQGGWRLATYSVLVDRMIGVLALALLVIVCLPWSFALIHNPAGRAALLIVGFGSVGACLIFLGFGFLPQSMTDLCWVTRQVSGASALARRVFAAPSSGIPVGIYSLAIHAMSVTAAWCLARSVAAPLEWGAALLLVLPVILIATIPLSIAGWGTRESAMVLAFGYAGLPESAGLIVSVLFGLAMFAAGLVGGAVWILDRGRRLREARQAPR